MSLVAASFKEQGRLLKSLQFIAPLAVCLGLFVHTPAAYAQGEASADSSKKAEPPAAADAPAPPPADWAVRWHELTHQLYGLQGIVETIPGTAFDEARNFPHEWGRTWPGLGKRFWNQYSQFLLSETIEFGVSGLHHEDPRYFRMGSGNSIGKRAWHTVRSTWVARSSNGTGERVALGRIAGIYGAWYIAARWSPDSVHGVAPFLIWGTFGMGTKSAANALREFGPDIKRLVKKHHEPNAAPAP